MDKLHISIFLLLGVAIFLGAMGVIGAQNVSNTNLEDAVNDLIQKDKRINSEQCFMKPKDGSSIERQTKHNHNNIIGGRLRCTWYWPSITPLH